jgi:hypothetical protein
MSQLPVTSFTLDSNMALSLLDDQRNLAANSVADAEGRSSSELVPFLSQPTGNQQDPVTGCWSSYLPSAYC